MCSTHFLVAGANNSGKTSIVELFNYVFNAKGALCSDDFPVYESQEWCTAVFPYFQAQFKQENKKDDLIANILGTIVPSENPENEMLLTPIEVLIQVDYDPAGDDIRNFADYIMELDPDNSSFYFIYRFELDKDLLRKSLDSEYEKLCNRFDKLVGDDDKDAEGIRIFIDEYQDTMSDVLKIFFESVHNTKTKLFLFGDRMQQIYKNYDGSFEESFELFDTTKALTTNYRSTKSIVNILNRIYNDPAFVQNISEKMRSTDSDFDPRIIISHSIQAEIENLRKTDPDTLILARKSREISNLRKRDLKKLDFKL